MILRDKMLEWQVGQIVTWLRFVKNGFVWGTGEGVGAGLC
jgi:hypothetical protein